MDPPQMQPPNSPVQVAPDVVGGQVATGRPVPQHHHFLDHEKDTVADDQGSQSSTQRRCTVHKVPVSRAALQEPNSSDDFVNPNPRNMRIKKSGVKLPKQAPPRTTRKETEQPIHPDKIA